MQIFIGGSGMSFQIYQDANNGLSITTDPDEIPTSNDWNHVVCTYNGGTGFESMSIY